MRPGLQPVDVDEHDPQFPRKSVPKAAGAESGLSRVGELALQEIPEKVAADLGPGIEQRRAAW